MSNPVTAPTSTLLFTPLSFTHCSLYWQLKDSHWDSLFMSVLGMLQYFNVHLYHWHFACMTLILNLDLALFMHYTTVLLGTVKGQKRPKWEPTKLVVLGHFSPAVDNRNIISNRSNLANWLLVYLISLHAMKYYCALASYSRGIEYRLM